MALTCRISGYQESEFRRDGIGRSRLCRLLTDLTQCQYRELQPIARSGLAEDALQVALHRVLADAQMRGDVAVLQAARHTRRDLPLAVREPTQRTGGGL